MSRFALLPAVFLVAAPRVGAQPSGLAHDIGAALGSTDYSVLLVDTFQKTLDFGVCVSVTQMVAVASRESETFNGICRFGGDAEAIGAVPERNLYQAGLSDDAETWSAEAARAVPVAWHRALLDAATADCVGAAWERAIRTAEYGGRGDAIDVDGEVDYFLRAGPTEDVLTAHAADPDEASVAGAMRALGFQIGDFARGEATAESVRDGCARLNAALDRLDP